MTHTEALTRQLYPSMAINNEELYLHMSDKDYLNRFSTPSRTTFTVMINRDEFKNKAVVVDNSNIRKLVIPRNSEFMVSNYTFTMEYPIEIRQMAHGGIQVVYDVSEQSPLQTLESNIVDWDIVRFNGEEYILIKIPVNQVQIKTYYAQINNVVKYSKMFPTTENYYYCRVYRKIRGEWNV